MEKDIVDGKLGTVGKYDVEFKEGKFVVAIDAAVDVGTAAFVIKLDAEKVLDALSAAIPSKIDDAIFGVIKAALLGK